MSSNPHYVAGWLNMTIAKLLDALPLTRFPSAKYALITCLDSEGEVARLVRGHHPRLCGSAQYFGQTTLLPTKELYREKYYRELFFGFDEVWFFPTRSDRPKPGKLSIVGPNRIDADLVSGLSDWLGSGKCTLGLGDGCGINVLSHGSSLTRHLWNQTLAQPTPELSSLSS